MFKTDGLHKYSGPGWFETVIWINMSLLQEFKIDMDRVMGLIEKGEEIRARVGFNYDIRPKYQDRVKDPECLLNHFLSFFLELEDYFNNDSRHLLGSNLSQKEIIDRYYSEYQKDAKDLGSE